MPKPETKVAESPRDSERFSGFREQVETSADASPSVEQRRWTARDGAAYHQAVIREAELGSDHEFVQGEAEVSVGQPDGSLKMERADLIYDGKHVVDIKTHDASDWTVSEAKSRADEHGGQVAGYMKSPWLEGDTTGTVVFCGREPTNPEAKQAYIDGLEAHGVHAIFPTDADPKSVAREIDQTLRRYE